MARWRGSSGRKAVIGIPYLWLLVVFMLPFAVVGRISLSQMDVATVRDLVSWEGSRLAWHGTHESYARLVEDSLYLRTFSRMPTEAELRKLEEHWGVTEEQPKVYTDIFWALMNAKEFMFNH